ncbi:MAG TPA: sigma-70 family RNA polymerase sigma factor [Vicinamibacterales bacterium]|nr:sigma-70 family RNA polymerase sigma factor [Vicinamibacterales bacterium]
MPATDVELVRGALEGTESAFREIVLRYQRPVYGLIVRMVRDPSRAEELAQDTFVKAFRALHQYDVQRKFSAWLLTIAHHVAIDDLRRGTLNTQPLEELTEDGLQTRQFADPTGTTPATLAERGELAVALQTAIGRLRPEYREVVTLRYERELDYDEISEITGLPMGTVKSSLHRARKELADHMESLGWNPTI